MSRRDNDEDTRNRPGRFSWVKKLLQSRNSSLSLKNSPHHNKHNHHKQKIHQPRSNFDLRTTSHLNEKPPSIKEQNDKDDENENRNKDEKYTPTYDNTTQDQIQSQTESQPNQDSLSTKSESNSKSSKSSKAPSVAHESIVTKPDNISTLPVISISTISARSSTFSENSQQSTSATVTSDHPTLFTNASTVGIAPASIFDRRERTSLHHFSINNLQYSNNNNSIHTFNTSMSPNSNSMNEHVEYSS